MTNENRGYTYNFVKQVQAANHALLGVRLGIHCISNDIPIRDIAKRIGVSRQTVYTWFIGKFSPTAAYTSKIKEILAE